MLISNFEEEREECPKLPIIIVGCIFIYSLIIYMNPQYYIIHP